MVNYFYPFTSLFCRRICGLVRVRGASFVCLLGDWLIFWGALFFFAYFYFCTFLYSIYYYLLVRRKKKHIYIIKRKILPPPFVFGTMHEADHSPQRKRKTSYSISVFKNYFLKIKKCVRFSVLTKNIKKEYLKITRRCFLVFSKDFQNRNQRYPKTLSISHQPAAWSSISTGVWPHTVYNNMGVVG